MTYNGAISSNLFWGNAIVAVYSRVAFGAWVQQSRNVLGYKQSALARKLAIHRATLNGIEHGARGTAPERRQKIVDVLLAELRQAELDTDARQAYVTAGLPLGTSSSSALESFSSIYLPPIGKRTEIYDTLLSLLDVVQDSWRSDPAMVSPRLILMQARATYETLLSGTRYSRDFELALLTIRAGIRWAQAEEAVLPWFARSRQAIKTYDHVEQFVIEQVAERFKRNPDFAEIEHEHAKLIALRAPLYREIGDYDVSIAQAEYGARLARSIDNVTLLTDLLRNRAHVRAVQGQRDSWEEAMDAAEAGQGRRSIGNMALRALHTYHVAEGLRRLAFDHRRRLSLPTRMRYAEEAIAQFALYRQQLAGWDLQDVAVGTSRHPLIPRVSEAQCRIWLDPNGALVELTTLRAQAAHDHPSLVAKIDFSMECARQLLTWRQHNPLPLFNLDARYKA
jgi:transcriptional regulator with XRE-family HTH domain